MPVDHSRPGAGAGARLSRRCFSQMVGAGVLGAAGLAAAAAFAGWPATAASASGDRDGSVQTDAASGDAGISDTGSSSSTEMSSRIFFVYNTVVTIKGAGITDAMFDELSADLDHYDELFSAQSSTSDVARINAAKGKPTKVDSDTADLIARSLEISELLDGSFDITVGTISLQWDFNEGIKPSDEAIAAALPHIGWKGVHVEGNTVTLDDPETKLDLGGVAKGWICARLRQKLEGWGIASADIDLGTSSIYLLGTKPGGALWRIGVRDPRGDGLGPLCIIDAADVTVAASGLYDQHFELDGVDYHHILDPKTGMPAQTDMLSLTALLDDPVLGDGLTTALFVRGTQDSLDWIAAHPGLNIQALFVDHNEELVFTPDFTEAYDVQLSSSDAAEADQESRDGRDSPDSQENLTAEGASNG